MSDNACCFCGDDVGRYGHNPAPVSDTGRCCDVCNQMVVIPARMSMLGLRAETQFSGKFIWDWEASVLNEDTGEFVVVPQELFSGSDLDMINNACLREMELWEPHGFTQIDVETALGYTQIDLTWELDYDSLSIMDAETILPGNITDIIMDEYLEQGESYEDAQEYARAATEKLKLDAEGRKPYPRNLPEVPRNLPPHSEAIAERKEIEARMLEIEDMENPSAEDLDNLEALESRYFELTGTFGAEETKSQFPAEAIAELKRNIVAFTGGAMMLSVFTAIGGFLLGRKTKEC